jgi:hypothetical protein
MGWVWFVAREETTGVLKQSSAVYLHMTPRLGIKLAFIISYHVNKACVAPNHRRGNQVIESKSLSDPSCPLIAYADFGLMFLVHA